jgi:D-beta-D-heptose 7-phosphate kinase/D-beta-D-heptose 1-phosphate adenosyltransferase
VREVIDMSPPRLTVEETRRLTARFADHEVLVIGDVMLDQYVWGEAGRISPEAPVPVVEVTNETMRLGGAANVALNIVSLGGRVRILSIAGADALAPQLRKLLQQQGIHAIDLIEDAGRPTTLKSRIIASRQQVVRIDRESCAPLAGEAREQLLAKLRVSLDSVRGIIVSDYGKGVVDLELMEELASQARRRGIFLSVDPKESHFYQYRKVSVVTPNTLEASRAARVTIRDLESLETAGRTLLRDLECDGVLITRGSEGMSLFREGVPTTHIPVMAREVFDVTGAGDTVIASFTLARVAGASLEQAAVLSNAAAAVVVGKMGTAAVNTKELEGAIAAGFPAKSES